MSFYSSLLLAVATKNGKAKIMCVLFSMLTLYTILTQKQSLSTSCLILGDKTGNQRKTEWNLKFVTAANAGSISIPCCFGSWKSLCYDSELCSSLEEGSAWQEYLKVNKLSIHSAISSENPADVMAAINADVNVVNLIYNYVAFILRMTCFPSISIYRIITKSFVLSLGTDNCYGQYSKYFCDLFRLYPSPLTFVVSFTCWFSPPCDWVILGCCNSFCLKQFLPSTTFTESSFLYNVPQKS